MTRKQEKLAGIHLSASDLPFSPTNEPATRVPGLHLLHTDYTWNAFSLCRQRKAADLITVVYGEEPKTWKAC